MAAPASSSLFEQLTRVWRLLSLRNDIDNIILELLGQFSLERIYAESDKEVYQQLVVTLVVQLNAIYYIQRLSLPSETHQAGWYLGYLVSWEVTMRTVELVLQVMAEGRESLWDANELRDKYLPELLLSSIRVLTLHPKAPSNQRAKDRRERFARIHRSLERIYDSYPGPKSFLLTVCKEVTDALRTDPSALALPPRLRYELPNLATELYPLPDCISSQSISTIVPQEGFSDDWLAQYLALRDVSHFVVGASVQYTVNGENRQVGLQSPSARSRNAAFNALEHLRMPSHLQKLDLLATFSDTFRIILPDTLQLSRRDSTTTRADEAEIDALVMLCVKMSERQVVHRVSDKVLVHGVAEITRNISLLDDPTSQARSMHPRLFAVNCNMCHVVGESQLRFLGNIKIPTNLGELEEYALPEHSKCTHCGESITMVREISLARHAWELLKPLEANADTINVERHLPSQFQLGPPKCDTAIPYRPSYGNVLGPNGPLSPTSPDTEVFSPTHFRPVFASGSSSPDPPRATPQSALPSSPGYRQRLDTAQTDISRSDNPSVLDDPVEAPLPLFSTTSLPTPSSEAPPLLRKDTSVSAVSFDPVPLARKKTVPPPVHVEKGSKSRWRKLTGSKKDNFAPSIDTSSLSSTTLEAQRLEEMSLKSLMHSQKSSRGRSTKSVNVYLSQNSTYALFWTQPLIHLWNVGTSPPSLKREFSTDGNCVLAAVTKMYLAYIVGTRDQKLTLRIVNLAEPSTPAVEYRMSSSQWCKSITICSKENYVVVGFENATVRFFRTTNSEPAREDRLHSRIHSSCRDCPAVDNLSFSHDGLVLLASTRSPKTGTIQLYSWRYPFNNFQELPTCRYHVPLHESEDNGVTSAIYRAGPSSDDDLVCMTTWTQSGTPLLVQPQAGHRSEIRNDANGRPGKLGNRIQCGAFSPTGRDIAMVNDKGHLYQISGLNSNPMDIKRIATSKELTAKSDSFSMAFMTLPDEEAIVLAWVDLSKSTGYVKKIPVTYNNIESIPTTPGFVQAYSTAARAELPGDDRMPLKQISRLTITEEPIEVNGHGHGSKLYNVP